VAISVTAAAQCPDHLPAEFGTHTPTAPARHKSFAV